MTGHITLKGGLDIEKMVEDHENVKHSLKRIKKRKKDTLEGVKALISKNRARKMSLETDMQKGFNSVVLTIQTSAKKVTALCYPSGKLLLMGANSMDVLEEAALTACIMLNKEIETPLRVSNVCGSGRIAPPFDYFGLGVLCNWLNDKYHLDDECNSYYFSASHEPERFPALIVNFKKCKATCTIFKSGIANITGTESSRKMRRMFNLLKSHVDIFVEMFKMKYK